MKLTVVLHSKNISWKKKWLYLGKSYLKLRNIEEKLPGERIKINKYLHEIYEKELKNYLEWIEDHRIQNNDSVYWWMSTSGFRNNADSDFFLYICQILSLEKILNDYKEEEEVLIVCEDIILLQTIIKNFKKHKIKKNNLLQINIFKYCIFDYIKILRNTLIAIIDLIFNFFCSKMTLKERKLPEKDIYLIHQSMSKNSLMDKNLKSRYFPHLKEFFDRENKNLYCLTWFNPFWSGKIKAFNNLRKQKHFIPEDWLSFYDYIAIVKNFFKGTKNFNTKYEYKKLNIYYLILNEKRNYLKKINFILRFWSYTPAIKKWSKNCNSLTCIDHYENMIFEHALIAAIRNTNKKKKIFGYHHTLASREFIPWHSLKSEWNSIFKPDYIISLGQVSKNMLIDQGVPEGKIINGPALRYNEILKKKNKNFANKNNIAVTLPPFWEDSLEIMSNILMLSEDLKNTKYKIYIKTHPNLNFSKILSSLNLKKLPENLIVSNKSLEENLNSCLFVISMSTGAVYDSVMSGNIVFNLDSELKLGSNYLDIFEKDSRLFGVSSINTIKNTLLSIDQDQQKIQYYSEEFDRLRKHLINGMNAVSDLHLNQFKLN